MGYRSSSGGVTVELKDTDTIMDRILDDRVGIFVASTWAKYFSKYVPMKSDALMSDISIEPWEVTYESPYAHYMWQGELYVSPTTGSSWAKYEETKIPTGVALNYDGTYHPLATSHWEVPAYEAFKDTVADQITQYIKRG